MLVNKALTKSKINKIRECLTGGCGYLTFSTVFFFGEICIFFCQDTRLNAETAKQAVDGSFRMGRTVRVRFATHAAALKVLNLGPVVTNELLHQAFSQFGDVERAVVVCDDRGRSKGYGIVEFSRKNSAQQALQQINDGLFLLGR